MTARGATAGLFVHDRLAQSPKPLCAWGPKGRATARAQDRAAGCATHLHRPGRTAAPAAAHRRGDDGRVPRVSVRPPVRLPGRFTA